MPNKYSLSKKHQKQLRGRVALVTGASSGLGADFAKILAANGIEKIFIVARRKDRLDELSKALKGLSEEIKVVSLALDLTKKTDLKGLSTKIKNEKISILVNNAGAGLHGPFVEKDLKKQLDLVNLNINALVTLSHAVASTIDPELGCYILQVASVAGHLPVPNYAVYGATKAFVLNFSQSLNWELRKLNSVSSALCPGATRTEFFQAAGHGINKLVEKSFMESLDVAKIGIEGMLNKEEVVVAGLMNKATVLLGKTLPTKVSRRMTEMFMK